MSLDEYEVYAIKYAHHDRPAADNFIGGDSHDIAMPLDYYVWAIVNSERTIVVDTGFDARSALRRGRKIIRPIAEGLRALGIEPDKVADVVITHLHYDHAGNEHQFPSATYHLQDREMAYATGRCMCHAVLRTPFDADDVTAMVRRVFDNRVAFHDGADEIAPGVSVHLIGGHSKGLQAVRVKTKRGFIVLASDAAHLYEHLRSRRVFPVTHNLEGVLEGYNMIEKLGSSARHVIPGHDPLVCALYPPARPDLADWIVRLDVEPAQAR